MFAHVGSALKCSDGYSPNVRWLIMTTTRHGARKHTYQNVNASNKYRVHNLARPEIILHVNCDKLAFIKADAKLGSDDRRHRRRATTSLGVMDWHVCQRSIFLAPKTDDWLHARDERSQLKARDTNEKKKRKSVDLWIYVCNIRYEVHTAHRTPYGIRRLSDGAQHPQSDESAVRINLTCADNLPIHVQCAYSCRFRSIIRYRILAAAE